MSKHDEARRAFLKGAAAGAVAGAALVPEAFAQTQEERKDAPDTTAQAHAHSGGHGAFLNDDDSLIVEAIAERMMPGAPGKPGARDAGVLNYIDLALAGAYADQQDGIGDNVGRPVQRLVTLGGDYCEVSTAQIRHRAAILRNEDEERDDTCADENQAEVSGDVHSEPADDFGLVPHLFEELGDSETEPYQ